jgi:FKBP-type peptidyl-prolyl cis-trans isomerase SlyD
MQIADNAAVFIHYTLKNDAGEVLDSSDGDAPLAYIHGQGDIVPGLESALTGKSPGEKLKVDVKPEDGYGVRDSGKVQTVPRGAFEEGIEITQGMQFQAHGPEGISIVTVLEVKGEDVVIDENHPLAGETLHFDIEIVDVREATQEELAHGHIHGAGGHHH